MPSSEETKQLVRRLADLVREIEDWVERGGSRWWLRGWISDARYLLRRIDEQDEIDRLEEP
jgi:hypothetical protein